CAATPAIPPRRARTACGPWTGCNRCRNWAQVKSSSTAWTATGCARATTSTSSRRCARCAGCRSWRRAAPARPGISSTCSPAPTWTARSPRVSSTAACFPSAMSNSACEKRASRCVMHETGTDRAPDPSVLDWDKSGGLLPAVVQDAGSLRVLMLGYMDREAFATTLEKGLVTFFSRSRQQPWTKGETSGNLLELVSIRADCDTDALLVLARPCGPTCHLGRQSCFPGAPGG